MPLLQLGAGMFGERLFSFVAIRVGCIPPPIFKDRTATRKYAGISRQCHPACLKLMPKLFSRPSAFALVVGNGARERKSNIVGRLPTWTGSKHSTLEDHVLFNSLLLHRRKKREKKIKKAVTKTTAAKIDTGNAFRIPTGPTKRGGSGCFLSKQAPRFTKKAPHQNNDVHYNNSRLKSDETFLSGVMNSTVPRTGERNRSATSCCTPPQVRSSSRT